jgi:hypothetical protein
MKNPALLSCRAQFSLQLKTILSFLAFKMAEKSEMCDARAEKIKRLCKKNAKQSLPLKCEFFS